MKTQTPEKLGAFYFHPPFDQNYWADILLETYKQRVYQRFMSSEKRGICVDIGANVGLVSYYFSQYFEKVFAVEPASSHIECIKAMIDQNKVRNIQIWPIAIGAKSDLATKFYHNVNQTMFSLKDVVNNKDDFEEVRTVTLADFMKEANIEQIDFMKLDCEGLEGDIVVSDGFTSVSNKIKTIVGEWHTWSSMNQVAFANCLKDQGFTFNWLQGTEASVFTATR